ncbi:hypothetical protein ENSA7_03000 [Enhygromyxa salina]|uniref:Uncharacterized protein n=2 Tax=Enhygromyxa salina TaxID=215803 RepID=A0A2S9YYD8_9BACT|nr:hypothetical protein ENSA7_03000 [Enhygromyxa salina]
MSYAEAADVLSGEYGVHGWDADGKPVALVTKPSEKQPGMIGKLLGLQQRLEVEVRELERPTEPEILRKALTGRLAGLKPEFVDGAESMVLDDLISLVCESIDYRLEQVRSLRPWRKTRR